MSTIRNKGSYTSAKLLGCSEGTAKRLVSNFFYFLAKYTFSAKCNQRMDTASFIFWPQLGKLHLQFGILAPVY